MTPKQYLDVLRRSWWAVVAGLVLGLAVAAGVTALMPRQYTADAVIFVSARPGPDLATAVDGSDLSAQRMATYVEVLRSQKIAQQVGSEPGIRLPAPEVASKINVSTVTGTLLLTVTVTDESPARAAQIANLAAARFVDSVAQLERPSDPTAEPLVGADIFAPATPDPNPVSPSLPLNLAAGAAIGLLAGFAIALLRRALDTTITSRRQLDEVLGRPVLGAIDLDPAMRKSPLVMFGAPESEPAEAFRQLRTNLQFVDGDRAPKVVLVASPARGDGRTTTVWNVGIASAEADLRVLLIDSDLRQPGIVAKLSTDGGGAGLADVLAGRVPAGAAIQAAGPGLDILPAGPTPQNPSEMLGSERMSGLIDEVRGSYDLVLLDSPPLLPVADAAVLARRADVVLLVVRHGRTTVAQVRACRDAVNTVAGRVIGSVLTAVPASHRGRGRLRWRAAPSTPTAAENQPRGESAPSPPTPGDNGRPAAPGGLSPDGWTAPVPLQRPPYGPSRPGDEARR